MKRAIRYLRFSKLGQSSGSIERQDLYTSQWLKNNKVELTDTFIDRGKSAKTFDRTDFGKLQDFITKYHRSVDYLVVDQMDRFSRNAGDALNLVKVLQARYKIQIVSVTEGIVFDYDTPGSFFRTGLQFLLAEEDNINRSIKIRGGNYTARAKEGRHLSNLAPFGYKKEGEGKNRSLTIVRKDAQIISFIYKSYINNVPISIIKEEVNKLGFNRKGNMVIQNVLQNPVYAGMVRAKAFKEYPGGLFPARHKAIIAKSTWLSVQNKMKTPEKVRTLFDENLPLRGVLKCYCGQLLTGAPSKGKSGKWYYYYKCKLPKHNNISATKSLNQFQEICELMSVSSSSIKELRFIYHDSLEKEFVTNKKLIILKNEKLEIARENLAAVEEKWIGDHITRETYDRFSLKYRSEIFSLDADLEDLTMNPNQVYDRLNNYLDMITDVKAVFNQLNISQKHNFIRMVFDNNLYYKDNTYHTLTMMSLFSHNLSEMKKRKMLFCESIFSKNINICDTARYVTQELGLMLGFLEDINVSKCLKLKN